MFYFCLLLQSGAVLGVMAATCLTYPDGQVGVAFVPNVSVSAQTALMLLVFIDTLGIFMRWRFMDHAGHLGGTFFGMLVCIYAILLAKTKEHTFFFTYTVTIR